MPVFSKMYWSLGKFLYDSEIRRRRKKIKASLKEVDIGIKIKYLEIGDPEKETVVIYHGFTDSKDSFAQIAQRLMSRYHLIIPDMPGFGENEQCGQFTYSIEQYSSWMHQFNKEVVGGSFHLIGHSMGGAIATNMVSDNPENVASMTVICGAGVITLPLVGFYKNLAQGINLFSIKNRSDFTTFLQTNFYKVPFIPGSVKHVIYKRYIDNHDWYIKVKDDLVGKMSENIQELPESALNHKLAQISVPTLIVWGEHDGLFPHDLIGQAYHQGISGSKLHVIDKAGHCLNLEAPGRFSAAFDEFIRNLEK